MELRYFLKYYADQQMKLKITAGLVVKLPCKAKKKKKISVPWHFTALKKENKYKLTEVL